jgi:hypothetical protein
VSGQARARPGAVYEECDRGALSACWCCIVGLARPGSSPRTHLLLTEQMFVGPGWERFQSAWWKLDGLSEPAVLAGAVSQAMGADLIVVAIRATEVQRRVSEVQRH